MAPASGGRPTMLDLQRGPGRPTSSGGQSPCSRIGTWMFCATVREREQRAVLEQDAPAARSAAARARRPTARRWPSTSIVAALRPLEADDGAQQHRLAGARAADQRQDLAALDVEVEAVVQDLLRRTGSPGRAIADRSVALRSAPAQMLRIENRMENKASKMMTRKMTSTTDAGGHAGRHSPRCR